MAKKVIIENGFNTSYAVIYNERVESKTGKRYMKQKSFPTSEEADKFLAELESKPSMQMEVEKKDQQATKIRFNDYIEDWFYREYSHMIKQQTFKMRQTLLNRHIAPYFGDKYLHEITELQIEELLVQKDREGYSKGTIRSVYNFLSTLFRSAVKKGYLDRNPVRDMNMVEVPKRIPVILSEPEINKLLEVAYSEDDGMLYEFGISTGLRLAEILALSWHDIDFDNHRIMVKKSVHAGLDGKHYVEEMRSNFRKVIARSSLLLKLQELKEEQQLIKEEYGDQYDDELDLVFPKKGGEVQRPSTVRARFNRLVAKAKISNISFHDLRITHASLLVESGAPLHLVCKQLGYKNVDTLYHLMPPNFSESMKTIKLFGVNDEDNDIE